MLDTTANDAEIVSWIDERAEKTELRIERGLWAEFVKLSEGAIHYHDEAHYQLALQLPLQGVHMDLPGHAEVNRSIGLMEVSHTLECIANKLNSFILIWNLQQ